MSRTCDKRGNAESRRRRKQKLLQLYGDGEVAPCVWCGQSLSFETLEQDRKKPGGRYVIENLQPACRFCNASRGNREAPKAA